MYRLAIQLTKLADFTVMSKFQAFYLAIQNVLRTFAYAFKRSGLLAQLVRATDS